jgi:DNA polymerase-3 subunit delta
MKPEELDRSIDKGEIAPLYFIFGDEEYLVERAVARILEKAVDPGFKDFNFSLFYGKEAKVEQILETAMTMPMFADRRVILVKRAEELSAESLESLLPYVRQPVLESCIVFQAAKIDQRRKFFLELKKTDFLIEYKKLKEEQLQWFIKREVEACGKKIEPAAAEMLVYYVGNNLRELVGQIGKLSVYLNDRPLVTIDDVRAMVSDTKLDNVFELANAIGERDLGKSMRRLQTVLRDTDAPYMLIGALASHFRKLCIIAGSIRENVSTDEISRKTGINPYFLKGMLPQARRFKADDYYHVFAALHDADLGMKSGGKPATLLEMLVSSICSGGNRKGP